MLLSGHTEHFVRTVAEAGMIYVLTEENSSFAGDATGWPSRMTLTTP